METRGQWAQNLVMEFQNKVEKWQEETGLNLPGTWGYMLPSRGKQVGLRGAGGLPLLASGCLPGNTQWK